MGRLVVICGLLLTLAVEPAWAQPFLRELPPNPPNRAPANSPPGAVPGTITESNLGPIYVKDKNGTPVVFPSITFEELERLIQLSQQQRAVAPPRFTFGPGATVTGTAVDPAAEIKVTLPITLNRTAEPINDWVRIPLRLNQAILLPPVEYVGEGEFRTQFDVKGDGYTLWLRAPSGTDHEFTFHCKVPLNRKNGARQLQLRLPDTAIKMQLIVNGSGSEATVSSSHLLERRRLSAQQSELTVDAAGGDLELSWRERDELAPVLTSLGNISVTLRGSQLDYDAQLNVFTYGAPIDSFIVRLPPGAELIGVNQATQPMLEYVLQPESSDDQLGRRLLVRRLEGKTTGPIEARLRCTVSKAVEPDKPTRIGGFEVIGAQQQKGTIDFTIDGDWSIDWQPDAGVRRVDDPPDVLRQQEVAARFEYDRQPFNLLTTIREKKTRITVEPTWMVSVDAQSIRLEGKLKYRMSGARLKPLELDTNGWTIDEVSSSDLPADDWQQEAGKLIVPLSAMLQGGGGEFDLLVRASRQHSPSAVAVAIASRLPRSNLAPPPLGSVQPWLGPQTLLLEPFRELSGDVSFGLPRPLADAGLPALVVISPADNVELIPTVGQLRSLISDTLPAEIKSTRQQPPLVYREDAAAPAAQFAGQFRVRPQSVELAVDTKLRVEERDTAVEQRFRYTIANEPRSQFRFLAPRELVESGRFELLLDGVPTAWSKQLPVPSLDASVLAILVELRDPRIGACELLFRHRHPHDLPVLRAKVDYRVPLIQTEPDRVTVLTRHHVRLTHVPTLAVELEHSGWSVADDELTANPDEIVYELRDVPGGLKVTASLDSAPTKGSTEIMRLWVQSLLTAEERRDRACFRLRTNEQQLHFQLPPGADTDPEDVTVAVNGQRADRDRFTISPNGQLRVELPEFIGPREATIELWYWFEVHPVPLGRLALQTPQLSGAARAERVYWQLLLPPNEHLAWHDHDLTAEHEWQQKNILWSRVPRRTQADLEAWVGASRQSDYTGFNTYLFSSVGAVSPKTVYTATRQIAVLGVAGVVLMLGAALLYQPMLRHPLVLLILGASVVGLGVAYPAPALAAAQLIVIGLALVFITGFLMLLMSRPAPKRVTSRAPSLPADSRHSKPASSRSLPVNSKVATVTLPAGVAVPSTGNEP